MQGPGGNEWNVRGNTALAFLALGLLSGATALPLFGFSARVVWWREQERGVKPFSYFLAASVVGLIGAQPGPGLRLVCLCSAIDSCTSYPTCQS